MVSEVCFPLYFDPLVLYMLVDGLNGNVPTGEKQEFSMLFATDWL